MLLRNRGVLYKHRQQKKGVQGSRQELKIIMYNNMRSIFWWIGVHVSDGSDV